VAPESPAARAGLKAGSRILAVDGEPLQDILDWLWLADGCQVSLTLAPPDISPATAAELPAALGHVSAPASTPSAAEPPTILLLTRQFNEGWGIEFTDPLFDGLRICQNDCVFCFMKMLPTGLRPSLYVRDDDYRLSFLQGNFVTLTNLSEPDLQRIIAMRLSPLHISLHAVTPAVRERLTGRNQARGLAALEQLLAAGIEFHAQIVLLPGVNDGAELERTLAWAAEQPGILSIGIVPYGHTRYAALQNSYTPEQAAEVIAYVTGREKVQLADEWFLLAGQPLPPTTCYGDFPQYEDGIGLLRSFMDEWQQCLAAAPESPTSVRLPAAYNTPGQPDQSIAASPCGMPSPPPAAPSAEPAQLLLVTGTAFAPLLSELVSNWPAQVLAVKNRFFGGNVDVAGLLTAADILAQVPEHIAERRTVVVLPSVMFNDDGLTLDGCSTAELAKALAAEVHVVDCKASELLKLLKGAW
jgi:NifB/MoaA-like Fe-S oxidoreductase